MKLQKKKALPYSKKHNLNSSIRTSQQTWMSGRLLTSPKWVLRRPLLSHQWTDTRPGSAMLEKRKEADNYRITP